MEKNNKQSKPKWDLLLYHVVIFISFHLLFVLIFERLPLSELGSANYMEYIKDNFLNKGVGIFQNRMVNRISAIWKSILMIHLIIEIIETLFPKKKKEKELLSENSPNTKEERATGLAWFYLITAGFLEIIWASALKMDMLAGPFIIVLIISFDFLIKSVKQLGVGTSYAVFTGIGVIGMVIADFLFFEEPLSLLKVLLVILLVVFIFGLKMSSNKQEETK